MNVYEMVILIVAVSVLGGVMKHYFEARGKEAEQRISGNTAKAQDLETRVASLTRRVRVLEEIVTSEGYDLKRKFAELDENFDDGG